MIKQKEDYSKYGKTIIPVKPEIFQLVRDILLSNNSNIQYKDILEIKRFLSIIDFKKYMMILEDLPAPEYLNLLDQLTDACLSNSSVTKLITIQQLLNESKDKEKFQILYNNKNEISNEDLLQVKTFLNTHVMASYIFQNAETMYDLSTKITGGEYSNIDEIVTEHNNMVMGAYREINNIRTKGVDERLDFDLSEGSITNIATETIKEIETPGFLLSTGFNNLDNALGGGLKRGALTLFGASTGGFKSFLMLNILCSIKQNNKKVETFDKTKKPCLVYLSLENKQTETYKRLIAYLLNKSTNELMGADSLTLAKDSLQALNTERSDPNLQIKFLYRQSNSIDTDYIYSIIQECETEGYEISAMFVDYLSTINSIRFKAKDMETTGLALADVARCLYNIAINHNIAMVSAFQLNRSAYNENNNATGKATLSMVGESIKMTTYADYIFMIKKEQIMLNPGTNKEQIINYLKFDEAKQRSNQGSYKKRFYEIFSTNNSVKLAPSKFIPQLNSEYFEKLDKLIEQRKEEESKKNKGMNNKVMYTGGGVSASYNGQANISNNINDLEVDADMASF